jgi:hypothetical protein
MTGEQDSVLEPLLVFLEHHGISYQAGWSERVPDSGERWPIGEETNQPGNRNDEEEGITTND